MFKNGLKPIFFWSKLKRNKMLNRGLDKVELLRSKITNAQTMINSNHIVQLLSARQWPRPCENTNVSNMRPLNIIKNKCVNMNMRFLEKRQCFKCNCVDINMRFLDKQQCFKCNGVDLNTRNLDKHQELEVQLCGKEHVCL